MYSIGIIIFIELLSPSLTHTFCCRRIIGKSFAMELHSLKFDLSQTKRGARIFVTNESVIPSW